MCLQYSEKHCGRGIWKAAEDISSKNAVQHRHYNGRVYGQILFAFKCLNAIFVVSFGSTFGTDSRFTTSPVITRTAGPGFPSQVIFSNFANTKQRGAGIEQVSLQPRQYGAVPTRLSNLV